MPSTSPDPALALRAAMARHDRHAVDAAVADLLSTDAPLGQQWRAIAALSRANGALTQARAAMTRYVAATGGHPVARFQEAAALAEDGHVDAATAALGRLPRDQPDRATHAHFAGTLALQRGEPTAAADLLREALRHQPASGMTWLALSEAMRAGEDRQWVDDVVAAQVGMQAAPEAEQAPFLYALGNALDAAGEHDRAFDAFAAGAAMTRRVRRYDPHLDARETSQACEYAPPGHTVDGDDDAPIFILGMPRSGTTLVEQMLAGHSQVKGGGEMPVIGILARDLKGIGRQDIAAAFATRPPPVWADDYRTLVAERFPERGRIVDKTLGATRMVGFLATVFPGARFVWLRRDPVDTLWSCFRTYFSSAHGWSWHPGDISHHMTQELRLLGHWQKVLGDRMMVLDYAELVNSTSTMVDVLLRHLGLPFEAAVLAPQSTSRPVVTASLLQVRQPVHRRSIGSAAPYRHRLLQWTEQPAYAPLFARQER